MKLKTALITTLAFFLIISTMYFWESPIGILFFPVLTILFLVFIFLFVSLLYQLALTKNENYKNKRRMVLIVSMILVLGLTIYRPTGVIDFEGFGGKDLLVAESVHVAACRSTVKLKSKNEFYENLICFGVQKSNGEYSINN